MYFNEDADDTEVSIDEKIIRQKNFVKKHSKPKNNSYDDFRPIKGLKKKKRNKVTTKFYADFEED